MKNPTRDAAMTITPTNARILGAPNMPRKKRRQPTSTNSIPTRPASFDIPVEFSIRKRYQNLGLDAKRTYARRLMSSSAARSYQQRVQNIRVRLSWTEVSAEAGRRSASIFCSSDSSSHRFIFREVHRGHIFSQARSIWYNFNLLEPIAIAYVYSKSRIFRRHRDRLRH